jgi:hypothetical protein
MFTAQIQKILLLDFLKQYHIIFLGYLLVKSSSLNFQMR